MTVFQEKWGLSLNLNCILWVANVFVSPIKPADGDGETTVCLNAVPQPPWRMRADHVNTLVLLLSRAQLWKRKRT